MSKNLYDLFADDQIAIDNKGVFGYDKSPEMQQKAIELQKRSHQEFFEKFSRVEIQQ